MANPSHPSSGLECETGVRTYTFQKGDTAISALKKVDTEVEQGDIKAFAKWRLLTLRGKIEHYRSDRDFSHVLPGDILVYHDDKDLGRIYSSEQAKKLDTCPSPDNIWSEDVLHPEQGKPTIDKLRLHSIKPESTMLFRRRILPMPSTDQSWNTLLKEYYQKIVVLRAGNEKLSEGSEALCAKYDSVFLSPLFTGDIDPGGSAWTRVPNLEAEGQMVYRYQNPTFREQKRKGFSFWKPHYGTPKYQEEREKFYRAIADPISLKNQEISGVSQILGVHYAFTGTEATIRNDQKTRRQRGLSTSPGSHLLRSIPHYKMTEYTDTKQTVRETIRNIRHKQYPKHVKKGVTLDWESSLLATIFIRVTDYDYLEGKEIELLSGNLGEKRVQDFVIPEGLSISLSGIGATHLLHGPKVDLLALMLSEHTRNNHPLYTPVSVARPHDDFIQRWGQYHAVEAGIALESRFMTLDDFKASINQAAEKSGLSPNDIGFLYTNLYRISINTFPSKGSLVPQLDRLQKEEILQMHEGLQKQLQAKMTRITITQGRKPTAGLVQYFSQYYPRETTSFLIHALEKYPVITSYFWSLVKESNRGSLFSKHYSEENPKSFFGARKGADIYASGQDYIIYVSKNLLQKMKRLFDYEIAERNRRFSEVAHRFGIYKSDQEKPAAAPTLVDFPLNYKQLMIASGGVTEVAAAICIQYYKEYAQGERDGWSIQAMIKKGVNIMGKVDAVGRMQIHKEHFLNAEIQERFFSFLKQLGYPDDKPEIKRLQISWKTYQEEKNGENIREVFSDVLEKSHLLNALFAAAVNGHEWNRLQKGVFSRYNMGSGENFFERARYLATAYNAPGGIQWGLEANLHLQALERLQTDEHPMFMTDAFLQWTKKRDAKNPEDAKRIFTIQDGQHMLRKKYRQVLLEHMGWKYYPKKILSRDRDVTLLSKMTFQYAAEKGIQVIIAQKEREIVKKIRKKLKARYFRSGHPPIDDAKLDDMLQEMINTTKKGLHMMTIGSKDTPKQKEIKKRYYIYQRVLQDSLQISPFSLTQEDHQNSNPNKALYPYGNYANMAYARFPIITK